MDLARGGMGARRVSRSASAIWHAARARTATYNTDAGNLLRCIERADRGARPGEPQLAHQTDEYCSMERIRSRWLSTRRSFASGAESESPLALLLALVASGPSRKPPRA